MFDFDLSLFRFQTTNTNFWRDQPTVEGTEKVQIFFHLEKNNDFLKF